MQITVRDDAPDLGKDKAVERVADGIVRAEVDDQRHEEIADFVRSNRASFRTGDHRGMWGHGYVKDATEAESFVIGQLTYLEAKAFARWYQPRRYQDILAGCIDSSAGPHAKAVDYLISDQVGIGQRINAKGTNMPLVDVAYAKQTIPVALGGIGYDYTVEDLVTSAFLGQPLPMTKQVAAIEAFQRHMNFMALQGELNFKGFYNNSGVTAANRLSGATWNAATADTIVNDIIDGYANYRTATGGNEVPTMMIFPLSSRQKLYAPRATTSDTTIETFIRQTLKVEIFDDVALETLGSGSTKRVVYAAPKNDNVVLHMPRPLQFLAPQMENLNVVVPGSYKYAGVEIRRVLSVRYMDGV